MKTIHFRSIHVDYVSMGRALDTIEELVDAHSGGYVVTPNVDHIILAERSASLREAYSGAALALADGMPLVWASKLLGHAIPDKVSGSDLVSPLLDRAAKRGMRVYFLGAAPGVGLQAASNSVRKHPGLQIVGVDAPKLGFDRDPDQDELAMTTMLAAQPDIVFVALGCPKQETLMWRWSRKAKMPVMLGLGASLDFLANRTKRAPRAVSAMGLEWLYRLAHDPVRLARRYLVRDMRIVPIFIGMLVRDRTELVSRSSASARENIT